MPTETETETETDAAAATSKGRGRRSNMHEYALGGTTDNRHWGTCRNPWDTSKTPGGSGGGWAAALATKMAVAGLGSDTSGFIGILGSTCGIVGLKPT